MDALGYITLTLLATLLNAEEDFSYKRCTREGIQCKDCFTVGNCVTDGKQGFRYDEYTDICPGTVVCDETSWYCDRKGYCRFKKFECQPNNFEEEVVFPDPYSCTLYHGCQGTEQYDYECPDGTAFNPLTKNCSLSINHRSCQESPVPICTSVKQRGEIPGDYQYKCVQDKKPPRRMYPIITLKV